MNVYNHYLNKKKMFLGILFVLSTVQVGAQAFSMLGMSLF